MNLWANDSSVSFSLLVPDEYSDTDFMFITGLLILPWKKLLEVTFYTRCLMDHVLLFNETVVWHIIANVHILCSGLWYNSFVGNTSWNDYISSWFTLEDHAFSPKLSLDSSILFSLRKLWFQCDLLFYRTDSCNLSHVELLWLDLGASYSRLA